MLNRPLSLPQSALKSITDRVKLSDFLPYLMYDEDNSLYIMKDESIAFGFELLPKIFATEATSATIESLLATLPPYASISILAYGSPYVDPIVESWKSLDMWNSVLLTNWKEKYAEFIKKGTHDQVTPIMKARMRDIRVFMSVKLYKSKAKQNFMDLLSGMLGPSKNDLSDTMGGDYEEAIEAKSRVQGALQTGNFAFWNLSPDILIRLLFEILNPSHNFSEYMPTWDKTLPISKQVIAYDTMTNISNNFLEIDGVRYKSLSVKEYPPKFALSQMGSLLGNFLFNEEQFSSPFLICYNTIKIPREYNSKLERDASIIISQKFPESLFPKLVNKQADLADGIKRIERSEPLVSSCLNLIVSGRNEAETNKNVELATAFWKKQEFVLLPDKFINTPVLLSCLPFCFDKEVRDYLGRSRLWFADTAASFFPIEGDWKGSQTPAIILTSRRGQLMAFDLFDSDTSFNAYIIATSGSGKSFFINYLTTNYLTRGSRVFILDIGRSYKKMCDICNGQWIEFDPKNPISLNPFSTLESEEELKEFIDYLINLVFFMGAPISISLSEEIEKLMKTYIEQAIIACYHTMGKEMLIDHIINYLNTVWEKEKDGRLHDFALQLEPYSTRGRFGKFFAGKCEIDFTSSLVVIENDLLESIPELRDPVMMIATFHISRNIYLADKIKDLRYKETIVCIDEGHKFLGSPKIDIFIEQAYRRFRKARASMILITQGFNDIYVPGEGHTNTCRVGRVIIENSAWKFLMLQTAESLQTLKKSEQIPLQPVEFSLLESIRPVKGQYSEMLVCTPWGLNTIGRYIPDRFSYYLYTSDKVDNNRIKEKISEGHDTIGAIELVIAEDLEREEATKKMRVS